MSLIDLTYPQASLSEMLKGSSLPLDGSIAIPWVGDQLLIKDKTGNAMGFAFENQIGGINITDQHMGTEAVTTANSMGGQSIMDQTFNQQAFTVGNPFGGANLYNSNFGLEAISFQAPQGHTMYSNDMEVLGITEKFQNSLHFSFPNFPVAAPSFHSLNDYATTNFAGHSDSISFLTDSFQYSFMDEGLGIFDWL
ncbi:hypothetical protein QA612_06175 [Evansella sp. AB-P1]|uniref:hypothetical protein n=1 Tax=Evansella sp. AB-P1 TaxID=3037653 RepID=UPI00241E1DB0|nr:hypothetical protein [Evansella sp. AB-P1]MDG5787073.1 hypothetical protein [Evansella sp. AB-P1]